MPVPLGVDLLLQPGGHVAVPFLDQRTVQFPSVVGELAEGGL
jgi:hypothetical protein